LNTASEIKQHSWEPHSFLFFSAWTDPKTKSADYFFVGIWLQAPKGLPWASFKRVEGWVVFGRAEMASPNQESGYCFWTAGFRNNCSEATNMTAITIGINTKPVFASGTHGGLCGGGGAGNSNPTAEPLNTKVTSARVNVVANVKTLFSAFLSFRFIIVLFSRFRSNIVNYSLAIWQVRRLTCS
jgi:hypothetical protein